MNTSLTTVSCAARATAPVRLVGGSSGSPAQQMTSACAEGTDSKDPSISHVSSFGAIGPDQSGVSLVARPSGYVNFGH